jgi:SAM-dependent methyltransferase
MTIKMQNMAATKISASLRKFLREIIRITFPRSVRVDGSIIASQASSLIGPEIRDPHAYLQSAEAEARRLAEHCGCHAGSRVLDVGCGLGRLPIGILRVIGEIDYTGIDIDRHSIAWCRRFIGKHHPSFHFVRLNLYNERYNRKGVRFDMNFRFGFPDSSWNIIYLFSVFSHTTEEDMRIYLKEFSRLLDPDGCVFFTTFVEENVPDITYNPGDYRVSCSGPLHIVRYDKSYLFSIVGEYGFEVYRFTHATEFDSQSGIYLRKKKLP